MPTNTAVPALSSLLVNWPFPLGNHFFGGKYTWPCMRPQPRHFLIRVPSTILSTAATSGAGEY